MPHQVYCCPIHGEFEVTMSVKLPVPERIICIDGCGNWSWWIPSAPNFIGGPTTGAKKE